LALAPELPDLKVLSGLKDQTAPKVRMVKTGRQACLVLPVKADQWAHKDLQVSRETME
jgi:hypothetical protein